jgi:hypothetical protein
VKDGVKRLTEKEVHHFGIPTAQSTGRKQTTEVQPFSFDERDKQLLKKKEETIQKVRFKTYKHTVVSDIVVISHSLKKVSSLWSRK